MMLTGRQIAEARALLGLSREDLVAEAGIPGNPTLKRIESFDEIPMTARRYVAAVRDALERAGVEFFIGEDGIPSVRLKADGP